MRRVVNVRATVLAAASETAVILAFLLGDISVVAAAIFGSLIFAAYVVAGVACVKASNRKLLASLVFAFVFSVVTSIAYIVIFCTYHSFEPDVNSEYEVSGDIDTVAAKNGVAEGVTLTAVKADGKKIRGKVYVVFDEDDVLEESLPLGASLSLKGKMRAIELVTNGEIDGASYRKNLRYMVYAEYSDAVVVPHKAGLTVRMRAAIYNRLRAACGDKYGSIAYCMLTGDKSELDRTASDMFTLAGIGHVLAISGLHVGLMSGILEFLLRKLRVPRLIRVISIIAALTLYAAFVGFTASVVRSVIMCAVALVTLVNGQRKDELCSLGLAYSVILAAQPFLLGEVGFLMSFSAAYGLVLFAGTFTKALRKIKLPKFMASPLSATVAAYAGTLPVSAYFFGATQTYSVLFNLLAVPLLSVLFALFLFLTPLSILFKTNVLLRVFGMGFALTDIFVSFAASLPLATLNIGQYKALFAAYPAMFVASRFFMLPKLKRTVSVCVFVLMFSAILMPSAVAPDVPRKLRNSALIVDSYADVTTVILTEKAVVAGDVKSSAALSNTLKRYGIKKLDAVILNKLTAEAGESVSELVKKFSVGKVVCPLDCVESDGLAAMGSYKNFYAWEESPVQGFTPVSAGARHAGYIYDSGTGAKLLMVSYSSRYSALSPETLDSSAIIRCFAYTNAYSERIYLTNMPRGYFGEEPAHQFSTAELGSFAFAFETGGLSKK